VIEAVLRRAISEGRLTEDEPVAMFFDLDAFEARLDALTAAFEGGHGGPPHEGVGPPARHTVAVKAMPVLSVLRVALARGFGLEVASEGELAIAEALGAEHVVFDSPAKTKAEIASAVALGYRLNADNWQELGRIADVGPSGRVGLRVNPEVSGTTIPGSFTGGRGSKFGIPISERGRLIEAFQRHAFLDGLHVHIGSQGVGLDVMAEGIGRVVDLALELGDRVKVLDIGGGLPVAYRPGERAPTFAEYAATLRKHCPALYSGGWTLTTEMGRALLAPCAFVASRVEYTKPDDRIAVVHVGADAFVRVALRPHEWHHEIDVHGPDGAPKAGGRSPWNIAGPLCFSADFVARDRELPSPDPGDLVVIRDAGAYTLAMWSRYNSRLCPEVVGYRKEGPLVTLKPRESVADVLRFWGG
jgi:diaminopimelate decarboxylase